MHCLKTISIFFSHPFVIAIVIFLLGKILINKIIPDKKQKIIEKIVIIKNLLKEVEFIYDRILNTSKYREKDALYKNISDNNKIFNKIITREFNRMSNLVNEKIPIEKFKLDSEIEIYFNDPNLTKIHNRFNKEFKKIHRFIVIKLPVYTNNTDLFQKKFCEIEELNFDELKKSEQELIKAIKKAKSIRLKSK